jgi:hypothetical protein
MLSQQYTVIVPMYGYTADSSLTELFMALQIAAMGGKVPERLSAGAAGGGGEGRAAPGPTPPPDVDGKKGGRSEAMPVSEFLAGGSVLPRKVCALAEQSSGVGCWGWVRISVLLASRQASSGVWVAFSNSRSVSPCV